jgi:hypothetical protein
VMQAGAEQNPELADVLTQMSMANTYVDRLPNAERESYVDHCADRVAHVCNAAARLGNEKSWNPGIAAYSISAWNQRVPQSFWNQLVKQRQLYSKSATTRLLQLMAELDPGAPFQVCNKATIFFTDQWHTKVYMATETLCQDGITVKKYQNQTLVNGYWRPLDASVARLPDCVGEYRIWRAHWAQAIELFDFDCCLSEMKALYNYMMRLIWMEWQHAPSLLEAYLRVSFAPSGATTPPKAHVLIRLLLQVCVDPPMFTHDRTYFQYLAPIPHCDTKTHADARRRFSHCQGHVERQCDGFEGLLITGGDGQEVQRGVEEVRYSWPLHENVLPYPGA